MYQLILYMTFFLSLFFVIFLNLFSDENHLRYHVIYFIKKIPWLGCGTWYHLPATPTVCPGQKSENFQSRNVTLSMPSSSKKTIAFDMICYAAYSSAAKFKLPIQQPSTAKCGIRRSWKLQWNWILIAVATQLWPFLTFQLLFHLDNPTIDGVTVA